MKKLKRELLFLIALLPLGLVSFAARSAYQDSYDQEKLGTLKNKLRSQRPLIFENGEMLSTVSDSYGRYLEGAMPEGQSNQEEFWKLLHAMEKKGLLLRQGEILLAKIPSIH